MAMVLALISPHSKLAAPLEQPSIREQRIKRMQQVGLERNAADSSARSGLTLYFKCVSDTIGIRIRRCVNIIATHILDLGWAGDLSDCARFNFLSCAIQFVKIKSKSKMSI